MSDRPTIANPNRPNILIVHADQHRLDCLGAYGNPDLRTPNIDALARDGVRYENSFCCFPICTPSRYSLLSGQYVHQHRGWNNHCTLPPGTPTFPVILRDAGYRTKAVGKMHFTPTYLDVGFEEMVLAEQCGDGRWDDDYHRELMRLGLIDGIDLMDQRPEYRANAPREYWGRFGAMASDLSEARHSTTWIGDRAVESLETWQDGGHLLMAGFIKPHHPFDPPAPWEAMYDPGRVSIPPGWTEQCLDRDIEFQPGYFPNRELTETAARRVVANYYAAISQIDHHVGRMVDTLRRRGLYDNTVIIYTSDHGDYMGFHHMMLKGGYMYDPLVKVPLIVKHANQARRGRVDDSLVNNIDIAPTLLRLAGLTPPPTMVGEDLSRGPARREFVFAEAALGEQIMARSRSRKLLATDRGAGSLFFDLEQDPLEMDNLYGSSRYADEICAFERRTEAFRPAGGLPERYLDEEAPRIDRPNAVYANDGHRDAVVAYYDARMAERLPRATSNPTEGAEHDGESTSGQPVRRAARLAEEP